MQSAPALESLLGGSSESKKASDSQQKETPQKQEQAEKQENEDGDQPSETQEKEEPIPKPSAEPVQPEIKEDVSRPLETKLPSATDASTRQQIQSLRDSLDQHQMALESRRRDLAYAESLSKRLDDEFKSFELRLEKAGLNLTDDYARLLRQRLDRLEKQNISDTLTDSISAQLSKAREDQLRLEEYEAVVDPDQDSGGRLRQKRSELLRQLHTAVTNDIEVLDKYFNTVAELQQRIDAYQELLKQRLFWLPSADLAGIDTITQLYRATAWMLASFHWSDLEEAISASVDERGLRMLAIFLILAALLFKRKRLRERLVDCGEHVGNVGHDRFKYTLQALLLSFLLALPGVLGLSLANLFLKEGNDFLGAVSKGLGAAAFIMLLLNLVHKVAREDGLGQRHFKWNANTLRAIRREIPILMAFFIPITILLPTLETTDGAAYRDSLGRILFAIASFALAFFGHRMMRAVRRHRQEQKSLVAVQGIAIAIPLILTVASLFGYHYTAVQLEGTLFISICWVAFNTLLYFMGLRGLSVRERRLTLERLREQRASERKLAEAREAAESSGEGMPPQLDMPEMDLKDISKQSTSLLYIIVLAITATGLWMFWAGVIPALQLFDDITLWTINTGIEGSDPLPITLGDLMLALLAIAGTVMAARNLPGTLEVLILSRMNLEPGSGYAITTIVTYIIILVGLTLSLAVLGLQWAKLQWLVAALGVGLGFGLQEIVANFVSGIILLFERPIRVGDTVSIDGITGTVSRIRIRATTLVDWDRKEQIIPNKTFVTQDLTNWTLSDPITRVIVRVNVAYGSDVDTVQDILYRVATENHRVVEDPAPAVFCVGLSESCINFEIRVFVKDLLDFMPLSHELHSSITRTLHDAGIRIPFPQRDIHIRTAAGQESFTEQAKGAETPGSG